MARGLLGLVGKLIGDSNTREIARLQRVVEEINALEPEVQALSADELRAKTTTFRRRLARGTSLDDLLPEAFAVAREAAWRTIGLRHYDVQLIGGMILHQGRIVEMKTGEGKTLVATLPLYLNGLALNPEWIEQAQAHWGPDPEDWEFVPLEGVPVGRGVHLVTVNDYLARRDGGWMGPSFDVLGLRVGLVVPHMSAVYDPDYVEEEALLQDDRLVHWRPSTRNDAYHADVTYGTNNEFGFDYLRDNMIRDRQDQVQRELNYAIIDEIDNVLIDEARTPLIISGPSDDPSELYSRFARVVQRLREEEDYEVDARTQVVTLTEQGINTVESVLSEIPSGEGLYDPQHAHMLPYLDNALHARVVYKRDKDYIVKDGQVVIVDEFTGRLLHGRRYSEGLHQAIEAKEGLAIQRESLTYGTITVQNYFRMYRKLAGMTGTAATEQEEFRTIYDLDVIVLPTNVEYRAEYGDLTEYQRVVDELEVSFDGVLNGQDQTIVTTYERDGTTPQRYFQRLDLPDAIYLDYPTKFEAIVEEIKALHEAGRPVLVGTIAVETSEHLSRLLKRENIPHNVLNAKQHEQEALVIAQAGRPGAVTIATNMAGRGVDIVLGGEPVALAARTLQKSLESRLVRTLGELADPAKQLPEEDLSEDARRTVQTLTREYTAYKQALEAGGSALPVFLTDQLIARGTLSSSNRSDGVRLVRHVLADAWDEAGTLAQQVQGLSLETLSEVQRIREQFQQARDLQHYIISGLSSTYHNLLMALIRLTLSGQNEAAQELVERYPELPPGVLETILEVRHTCRGDQEQVRHIGGLHVVGTERHDARRIDNQLRGRAGRQGDPGSSRFYLSMEDELMRRFGGERVQHLMRQWGMGEVPLEFGILSKTVESAQSRVEGYNFDIRKHVLEYDDVVNKQREVIYDQRWQVLNEPNLRDQVLRMVDEEIDAVVAGHCDGGRPEDWDLKGLYSTLRSFIPLPAEVSAEEWAELSPREIEQQVSEIAEQTYDQMYQSAGHQYYESAKQQEVTLENMRRASDSLQRLVYRNFVELAGGPPDDEMAALPVHRLPDEVQEQVEAAAVEALGVYRDRQLMLRAVDSLWVRYLTDLAILREGIGLRAFGQQDPLVAFRREAHDMYQQLLGQIQSQVARSLFLVPVAAPRARSRPQLKISRPAHSDVSQGPVRAAGTPAQGPGDNPPGRNDPCWCGSGKKYKHCHLRQDQKAQRSSSQSAHSTGASKRRRRRR